MRKRVLVLGPEHLRGDGVGVITESIDVSSLLSSCLKEMQEADVVIFVDLVGNLRILKVRGSCTLLDPLNVHEPVQTPPKSSELRIRSLELAVEFCAGCPGTPTKNLLEIAGRIEKYIMEVGNGKDS